jgi:16S rRNA (guanine1207-N2)-methyltransferase
MSGPSQAPEDDLAGDPGVLAPEPVFEVGGWSAVARIGGAALLHWRGEALRAASQVRVVDAPPATPSFSQALVRIGKGRAATAADLASAWSALLPGGRLLVVGHNEVGITALGRRLQEQLGQPAQVLANRARGRVLAFTRSDRALDPPAAGEVPLGDGSGSTLAVLPGVFSGDDLDHGTALLQAELARRPPAAQVVDLGCGAGHLGLAAAKRWPQARVWLGDADLRAVRSTRLNASRLGVTDRCTVAWWDAGEALPATAVDLALVNPPCHAGVAVSLATARRLFQVASASLGPQGELLVVANRRLPYEADLAALGSLEVVTQEGGFKVLALRRAWVR